MIDKNCGILYYQIFLYIITQNRIGIQFVFKMIFKLFGGIPGKVFGYGGVEKQKPLKIKSNIFSNDFFSISDIANPLSAIAANTTAFAMLLFKKGFFLFRKNDRMRSMGFGRGFGGKGNNKGEIC